MKKKSKSKAFNLIILLAFIIYITKSSIIEYSKTTFLTKGNFLYYINNNSNDVIVNNMNTSPPTIKTIKNLLAPTKKIVIFEDFTSDENTSSLQNGILITNDFDILILNMSSEEIRFYKTIKFFYEETPKPLKIAIINQKNLIIFITESNDQFGAIDFENDKFFISIPENYQSYADLIGNKVRIILLTNQGDRILIFSLYNLQNIESEFKVGYRGSKVNNILDIHLKDDSHKILMTKSDTSIAIFELVYGTYENTHFLQEIPKNIKLIPETYSFLLTFDYEIGIINISYNNDFEINWIYYKFFDSKEKIIYVKGFEKSSLLSILLENSKIELKTNFYEIENGGCHIYCAECSKGVVNGHCTTCKEGFNLEDGKCVPKCDPSSNLKYFKDGSCQEACGDGYFANTGYSCQKCPRNCKKCNLVGYCIECSNGLVNSQGSCPGLNNCPKGQYFNKEIGNCKKCALYCSQCQDNWENCLECNYFNKGKGWENLVDDNSTKIQCDRRICKEEEVPNYKTSNCDQIGLDGCKVANWGNMTDICSECNDNFYNNYGKCVKNCGALKFENVIEKYCQRCLSGWNNCTSCQKPYYLFEDRCVGRCPLSYYSIDQTRGCKKCSEENCVECFDDVCTVCKMEFIARDGKCLSSDEVEEEEVERQFYFSSGIIVLILLFPIYVLVIYSCIKLCQGCWKQYKNSREYNGILHLNNNQEIDIAQLRRHYENQDENDAVADGYPLSEFDSQGIKMPELSEKYIRSSDRRRRKLEEEKLEEEELNSKNDNKNIFMNFRARKKKTIFNKKKNKKKDKNSNIDNSKSNSNSEQKNSLFEKMVLGSIEEKVPKPAPYKIPVEKSVRTLESNLSEISNSIRAKNLNSKRSGLAKDETYGKKVLRGESLTESIDSNRKIKIWNSIIDKDENNTKIKGIRAKEDSSLKEHSNSESIADKLAEKAFTISARNKLDFSKIKNDPNNINPKRNIDSYGNMKLSERIGEKKNILKEAQKPFCSQRSEKKFKFRKKTCKKFILIF